MLNYRKQFSVLHGVPVTRKSFALEITELLSEQFLNGKSAQKGRCYIYRKLSTN